MCNNDELVFLVQYVSNRKDLKILDVGCGIDFNLLLAIHDLIPNNVSKLIGVDRLLDDDGEELSFTLDNISDINKFELIKQDGFSYLDNLIFNQDLIIFSNFLHFYSWKTARILIQTALSKLTPEGLIYIRVRNKSKVFKKNNNSNRFDMSNIEEIKSFSKLLFFKEDDMFYKLVIKNK